jgi:hypothetical protein
LAGNDDKEDRDQIKFPKKEMRFTNEVAKLQGKVQINWKVPSVSVLKMNSLNSKALFHRFGITTYSLYTTADKDWSL